MYKLIIRFAVLKFLVLLPVQVEGARLSGSWDIGGFSSYVYGVTGETLSKQPVIQSSITLADRTGVYAKFLSALALSAEIGSDSGNEVDFLAGYAKDFGDFSFDAGYARYYQLFTRGSEKDLNVGYASVTSPDIRGVRWYVTGEADVERNRLTQEVRSIFLYQAGLKPEIRISESWSVNLDISTGGRSDSELLNFVRLGISATFKASERMEITPQINFQGKSVYAPPEIENKVWAGVDFLITMF